MSNAVITLSIYSRPECHLCEDLIAALKPWQSHYLFDVEIIDISANEDLTARYAARIPILVYDDVEISEYFLDASRLEEILEKSAVKKQTNSK